MNRFIISLSIFLIFASFAKSIPFALEKRDDALSGFKQCNGDFPNVITSFGYSPDPIIAGQMVNAHIAGEATAVVEKGASITLSGYYENVLDFMFIFDYCELFVEQSGFHCPKEKGDFDFKASWPVVEYPDVPKNSVFEYELQIAGTL